MSTCVLSLFIRAAYLIRVHPQEKIKVLCQELNVCIEDNLKSTQTESTDNPFLWMSYAQIEVRFNLLRGYFKVTNS